MYVVWKSRKLKGAGRCEFCQTPAGKGRLSFIPHIVESHRVEGTPRQVHIARLPSIRNCCLPNDQGRGQKGD